MDIKPKSRNHHRDSNSGLPRPLCRRPVLTYPWWSSLNCDVGTMATNRRYFRTQ